MKKKRKGYTKKTNFTKNMKWTKNISKKGEVTVVFKRTKKEDADIFTKNTKDEINERLIERFMKKED